MISLTKQFLFLLLSITFILSSCSSARDKEASEITSLEDLLKEQAARPDKAKLDELLSLYTGFVDRYPDDTASPMYLYRAVNLSMGMNNGQGAMILVDRTLTEYPKSPRLAETVFLKAYIYENQLGNLGKASSIYRDFIHRFPDHELADDAQTAIENMGKTPEELVKEFETKAAEAQVKADAEKLKE